MKLDTEIDLDLFDPMAYLDARGVDYTSSGSKNVSTGWIGTTCRWCGDRTNHLGINLTSKKISCFKCGKKGNVLTLVMAVDNCSFNTAKRTVLEFSTVDFAYLVRKERLHAQNTLFPTGIQDKFLPMQDQFLLKRRYDREFLQKKYDIMPMGPTLDDWKFRIIIPVYEKHQLVTYVGRDVTGKLEIPYKNAPIEKSVIQAKHSLYNFDSIRDTAIVVEGIMDVWRIGNGAVCSFGTQYTKEQILKLVGLKRIFVLYDADAPAEADRLSFDLTAVCRNVEVILLDEGDPDNLHEDDVWALRRELGL